jgi:hypothetical protein
MLDILSRQLNSPEVGFVVRDLAYETLGHHPITYGDFVQLKGAMGCFFLVWFFSHLFCPLDGTLGPRETVLTHTADHCCSNSIDYMLYLGKSEGEHLQPIETRVEMFLCEPGEADPCTQLSDHYGVVSLFKM